MILRVTVAFLLLSTVALPQSVQALAIDDVFHFRINRGPNQVGQQAGDVVAVGAQQIVPSGPPTTVTATQGNTTRSLAFVPFSFLPDLYTSVQPFNPGLVDSWTLTVTNGVETVTALTPPIPNPKIIPLVTGLQIVGTGPTPTLQWTLPNLSGFSVDQLGVRVFDLDHPVGGVGDIVFDNSLSSQALGSNATSFVIPDGILQIGTNYAFSVTANDFESAATFGSFVSNRSETFSDPFQPVPEPATLLLFGSTAAGLALARWRRSRGKQ